MWTVFGYPFRHYRYACSDPFKCRKKTVKRQCASHKKNEARALQTRKCKTSYSYMIN